MQKECVQNCSHEFKDAYRYPYFHEEIQTLVNVFFQTYFLSMMMKSSNQNNILSAFFPLILLYKIHLLSRWWQQETAL